MNFLFKMTQLVLVAGLVAAPTFGLANHRMEEEQQEPEQAPFEEMKRQILMIDFRGDTNGGPFQV